MGKTTNPAITADEDDDLWRALRDLSREKRERNTAASTALLNSLGIPWRWKDEATRHVLIELAGGGKYDFWPSTGTWTLRGSNRFDRGVKGLIGILRRNDVVFANGTRMADLVPRRASAQGVDNGSGQFLKRSGPEYHGDGEVREQ